jgi:Glucodextranase, domain B
MATRRTPRPTHVRPRPPSSGRPTPKKARPRSPAPGRLSLHTPIRRTQGIPLLGRLALAIGIVVVAAGVLYLGIGGLSSVASSLGATIGGFVQGVTATPTPRPTQLVASDAPSIQSPTEPYTNQDKVDLIVTVPTALVGNPAYHLKIYLALADQAAAPISEVPIGATARSVVPVKLTKGINDFTVTIIGPGGESEHSPLVRYVLDANPPGVKLTTPRNGATVNGKVVEVKGRTQARTTIIARNQSNGTSITVTAGADGTFDLKLALAAGANKLHFTATDPAGNVTHFDLTVKRGAGKLVATVSLSAYRIPRSALPERLRLVAQVTDPDGNLLAGARVTFTVSIPGIPTVTGSGRTDANGRAVFQTTIPKGASVGQGSVAILVKTSDFGQSSDQTVVSITR